jgi:outer membrane protein TolC
MRHRRGEGPRTAGRLALLLALGVAGCRTVPPDPVEPRQVLAELDAVEPTPQADGETAGRAGGTFDPTDGLTLREAAAFALGANPGLRETRARLGVARAQLVEAGLLPDPTFSWDATDWLVDPGRDAALGGLGLMWEVPRPGEIPARRARAAAQVAEAHQQVLAAEWRLVREVTDAWLEVLAARERLALNERLLHIVRRTHAWFHAAREAKAATALQENLSGIELAKLETDRRRLLVDQDEARETLNALLGLRPDFSLVLQAEEAPFRHEAVSADARELLVRAVHRRPDLAALQAVHDRAEAALRLEVARQAPKLAVGTGFEIQLPLLSGGNAAAIRTKLREREQARRRIERAVHELRAQVHAALLELRRLEAQIRFVQQELEPRLAESVALAREARSVTQITPLELLTSQRQVLEVRTRILELHIAHRKARARLATLDGTWDGGPSPAREENQP